MRLRSMVLVGALGCAVPLGLYAAADKAGPAKAPAVSPEVKATYDDIQKTMGSVPTFLKQVAPEAIPGVWEVMKNLQLNPKTAIPGKYKELIGLGVAAQIPCKFCVYFHTEAAKLNGATDREIRETIAEASLTRYASTILNGNPQDEQAFRSEIARAIDYIKKNSGKQQAPVQVTDAQSAYKEITSMMGVVPTFLKKIPPEGVAGTWKWMRDLDMNPNTAVPGKYKALISMAVASQIPCRYCVIADAEFAKMDGTTDAEMQEAVAMAAMTRAGSTFLNGISMDEATFKREANAIIAHAKKQMAAQPAQQKK